MSHSNLAKSSNSVLTSAEVNKLLATDGSGNFTITDNNLTLAGTAILTANAIQPSATLVFNESGDDFDIRFEGSGNENLLYLDAENDRVGIGTAAPTSLFHISSISVTAIMTLENRDTTITDGQLIGALHFSGADAADPGVSAKIEAINVGANANTSLVFTTGTTSAPIESMIIDNLGNVGIGTDAPIQELVLSKDGSNARFAIDSYGSGGLGGSIFFYSPNGTKASPTVTLDDDILGTISFRGWDNSISIGATISGEADGDWGDDATDSPARLVFSTTPDGEATSVERMRIDNAGNVGIGTAAPIVGDAGVAPWLTISSNFPGIALIDENNANLARSIGNASGNLRIGIMDDDGTNYVHHLVLLADGKLGVGTAAPLWDTDLSVSGTNNILGIASWSTTDSHTPAVSFVKSNSATVGTYLETANNEVLGTISASGVDANDNADVSTQIKFEQDAAATATLVPGRIIFKTTSQTVSLVERMRIDKDGNVGIGTDVPGSKLSIKSSGATSQSFIDIEDSAGVSQLVAGSDASGNTVLTVKDTAGAAKVTLHSAGDSFFNGGNVGIGTTAPGQILDCNAGSGNMIADGYDNHPSFFQYKTGAEIVKSKGYLAKIAGTPIYKFKKNPYVSAEELKVLTIDEFGQDSWDEKFPEETSHRQKALYNMESGEMKTFIDSEADRLRLERSEEHKNKREYLSIVIDDTKTVTNMAEMLIKNESGNVTGFNMETNIGMLHLAVQELAAKVVALEA